MASLLAFDIANVMVFPRCQEEISQRPDLRRRPLKPWFSTSTAKRLVADDDSSPAITSSERPKSAHEKMESWK